MTTDVALPDQAADAGTWIPVCITDLLAEFPRMAYRHAVALSVLKWFARTDDSCFPRHSVIAEKMQRSVDYVRRVLRECASAGYIEIEPRARSDGGTMSNLYRFAERVVAFFPTLGRAKRKAPPTGWGCPLPKPPGPPPVPPLPPATPAPAPLVKNGLPPGQDCTPPCAIPTSAIGLRVREAESQTEKEEAPAGIAAPVAATGREKGFSGEAKTPREARGPGRSAFGQRTLSPADRKAAWQQNVGAYVNATRGERERCAFWEATLGDDGDAAARAWNAADADMRASGWSARTIDE